MMTDHIRRGIAAAKAGRKGEARAAFRAVLVEDPKNETALLGLAYLADDPRASLAYIARALEAHPQSPRAHTALRWARRRMTESRIPGECPSPALPEGAPPGGEAPRGPSRTPPSRPAFRWWLPLLWLALVAVVLCALWPAGWAMLTGGEPAQVG